MWSVEAGNSLNEESYQPIVEWPKRGECQAFLLASVNHVSLPQNKNMFIVNTEAQNKIIFFNLEKV